MPNFTFCGKREDKTTTLFFFPWTSIQSFRIQLQKNSQHLTNWTRWNKRDKVWSSATSLLKWPFRSRRRRCCWSSLMSQFQSLFSVDLFVYTHNSGKSICSLVLYISAWKTLFEANRPSFRVLSGYKMPKLPKRALQCPKFGHWLCVGVNFRREI